MRCTRLQYAICALVAILVLLQLIHLTMISWLENKGHDPIEGRPRGVAPRSDYKWLGGSNRTRHRKPQLMRVTMPSPKLNTYGSYEIFYDFARTRSRPKSQKRRDVSLVTHCSMNNLFHLQDIVERWNGPISIAVFGRTSDVKTILSYVFSLQECVAGIKRNVTFHLVHPVGSISEEAEIYGVGRTKYSVTVPLLDCKKIISVIKTSEQIVSNYAQDGIQYPNNLLRNVGRSNVFTDYHVVLDVDMLPNAGLRENFLNFIQGSSSLWLDQDMVQQMVFVLPAFEVDTRTVSRLPADKRELMFEFERGTARQFYEKACPYCQNHTDYPRWTSLQSFTGQLGVAYTVEWKPLWEPFYISRSDVPLYDERFRQYGYNRISQVCELYMAGYNFAVLDRAFISHKGFKEKAVFHQQKDEENRYNYYLFLQFHAALENKYPETKRRCVDTPS